MRSEHIPLSFTFRLVQIRRKGVTSQTGQFQAMYHGMCLKHAGIPIVWNV